MKEDNLFDARHTFWDQLSLFWPEHKVLQWKQEVFSSGLGQFGAVTVANLITLSCNAHVMWNRGAFAIKPISINDDQTTLKVQFFWQQKKDSTTVVNLLDAPESTKDLTRNQGAFEHGITSLFNFQTRALIKSGDVFELRTDNPLQRPLPSFALLELQFFLTRVVGMAGAAFPYEPDWEDEDDGEVSDLGLDESDNGESETEWERD